MRYQGTEVDENGEHPTDGRFCEFDVWGQCCSCGQWAVGPFNVEYGTRNDGSKSEEFDELSRAHCFIEDYPSVPDFFKLTDSRGCQIQMTDGSK